MKSLLIFALIFLVSCGSSKINKTERSSAYYELGTSALVNKQYSKALKYLRKAHVLTPNDTKVNNNLGMAYFFKKEVRMAKKHLKRALKVNPKYSNARNNLASIYYRSKKYKLARKLYKEVLKDLTYENQFRTYYNLGLISLKQNRTKEAKNLFARSVKENPGYCSAHFMMGKLALKDKNLESAKDSFKNASYGQCYELTAPKYYLGLTYNKLGDEAKAKDLFIHIIKKNKDKTYVSKSKKVLDRLLAKNEIVKQSVKGTMASPQKKISEIIFPKKKTDVKKEKNNSYSKEFEITTLDE